MINTVQITNLLLYGCDYLKIDDFRYGLIYISVISLKVLINQKSDNTVTIHSIYRPPDTIFQDFLDLYEKMVFNSSDNSIILGDTNVNILNDSTVSQKYVNLIASYGFQIGNTFPTRKRSGTLIDHFVSNMSHNTLHHTINVDFSDHS